jgi:DNA-binding transcriptional LysR family regulator
MSVNSGRSLGTGLQCDKTDGPMHGIQKMDWRTVDLDLMVVFQAMLENRGVTRAGAALGLSQPAMNAALARLRELFRDPLFVRSGTEMKPTTRAPGRYEQDMTAIIGKTEDAKGGAARVQGKAGAGLQGTLTRFV